MRLVCECGTQYCHQLHQGLSQDVRKCHKMSQVTPYFAFIPLHPCDTQCRGACDPVGCMSAASFFLPPKPMVSSLFWWALDEGGKPFKSHSKAVREDPKLIHVIMFGHLRSSWVFLWDLHLGRIQLCLVTRHGNQNQRNQAPGEVLASTQRSLWLSHAPRGGACLDATFWQAFDIQTDALWKAERLTFPTLLSLLPFLQHSSRARRQEVSMAYPLQARWPRGPAPWHSLCRAR